MRATVMFGAGTFVSRAFRILASLSRRTQSSPSPKPFIFPPWRPLATGCRSSCILWMTKWAPSWPAGPGRGRPPAYRPLLEARGS